MRYWVLEVCLGVLVGTLGGCGEPLTTSFIKRALPPALCPAGTTVLGTVDGQCTYTPNGNDPTKMTLGTPGCEDGYINCPINCAWRYNPGSFSGSCTTGDAYGLCPQPD